MEATVKLVGTFTRLACCKPWWGLTLDWLGLTWDASSLGYFASGSVGDVGTTREAGGCLKASETCSKVNVEAA